MEGIFGPTPGHSKSGSRKGFRYHDHWIMWECVPRGRERTTLWEHGSLCTTTNLEAMDDIPAEENHAAEQTVRETKSHYGSIVRSAEVSNQDHRTVAEGGYGLRTNQHQSKNHS
ncbi:hypothetical protein GE21DRAFT_1305942 [Neurospora crassa]|nr:hypothetical protein GE21DRAFT_1305942 [Neurospora crassa]